MDRYRPMRNDRRDFDPMGAEWGYALDMYPPPGWRQLVAVKGRRDAWPFGNVGRFQAIRLAPDWCHCSWHPYYVLAWPGWDQSRDAADAEMHQVTARLVFERRTEHGGRHRLDEWTGVARLDLRTREWTWHPCARDADKPMPPEVTAEVEHRCAKLLAFFDAAIEHWRAGDQARPVSVGDLLDAVTVRSRT